MATAPGTEIVESRLSRLACGRRFYSVSFPERLNAVLLVPSIYNMYTKKRGILPLQNLPKRLSQKCAKK